MPTKKSTNWLSSEKGELVIDVYQTEDYYYIQSPIAGITKKDLDISVEEDTLVIKGTRPEPTREEGITKHNYQECYWGDFLRTVSLSEDIDPSRVKATLEKGILTIEVPKVKKEGKHKISIK